MVKQVRAISGFYEDDEARYRMKTPSYAIQVGNTLKRCANVLCGLGIRRMDKAMRERKFLSLNFTCRSSFNRNYIYDKIL